MPLQCRYTRDIIYMYLQLHKILLSNSEGILSYSGLKTLVEKTNCRNTAVAPSLAYLHECYKIEKYLPYCTRNRPITDNYLPV